MADSISQKPTLDTTVDSAGSHEDHEYPLDKEIELGYNSEKEEIQAIDDDDDNNNIDKVKASGTTATDADAATTDKQPARRSCRCDRRMALYILLGCAGLVVLLIIALAIAVPLLERNAATYLTPPASVVETIEAVMDEFDPLLLDFTSSEDFGEVNFFICTANALVNYTLGTLTGLSLMEITELKLLPGTEQLDIQRLGFGGASWSAQYNVTATFPGDLQVDVGASLQAEACGMNLDQDITGMAGVQNATVVLTMYMEGEASLSQILDYTSRVDRIDLLEVDFDFDKLIVDIDAFDKFPLPIDFGTIFASMFTDEVKERIRPLIQEAVQEELNDQVPFTP